MKDGKKNAESFVYEALGDATKDVRILTIEPDHDDATIKCSLGHRLLDDSHTCLSYTWGTEPASETIFVNGKQFQVRPNLWRFLHTARRLSYVRPFWIDAICIDQMNNKEKGSQVSIIGDIYFNAVTVIVWLDLWDVETIALYNV